MCWSKAAPLRGYWTPHDSTSRVSVTLTCMYGVHVHVHRLVGFIYDHVCIHVCFSALVTAQRPDDISVVAHSSPQLSQHIYHVVCKKLGEQELVIEVGNGPTLKNAFPVNETTSIRLDTCTCTCILVCTHCPRLTCICTCKLSV